MARIRVDRRARKINTLHTHAYSHSSLGRECNQLHASANFYIRIMKPMLLLLLSSLAAGFMFTCARAAEKPDDLSIDVGECIKLESEHERFACYEHQVAAARRKSGDAEAAPDGGKTSRSETSARPAEPAQPAAEATKQAEAQRHRAARKHGADEDAERGEAIVGTIAVLDEIAPERYLITLSDGQVWRQTRSGLYPLRVGNRVRIYPTRWGASYRLTVEELRGFIQVDRVR
jgi:hypothetical protein